VGAFFYELVHVGIYKRTQGRITRQITFAGLALVIALGLLRLSSILMTSTLSASAAAWFGQRPFLLPFYWIAAACEWVCATRGFYLWFPGGLLIISLWGSYRVVNVPSFADFLIAVEAEMNKVSWPTRTELFRASMVVLILIFSLAIILAGYDYFWIVLLRKILNIV